MVVRRRSALSARAVGAGLIVALGAGAGSGQQAPAPVASATAGPPAPPPCHQGAPRQFDFWLGEWEVFLPDGSRAGHNRIELVAGGCALLERWQGRGGFSGSSLNRFDPAEGRWQQWWVDSSGAQLQLSGRFDGTHMVLTGRSVDPARPQAAARHERIRWTPTADGSVRQLWEQSDDGQRWRVVFDGRYVRAGKAS